MDLRTAIGPALTGVWLVVSAVLFLAAVAPFVLDPEVLYGAFTECSARASGSSCPLCGMTAAYILIAHADFGGALDSNSGSVPLWAGSLVNFSAAGAYVFAALRRKRFQ